MNLKELFARLNRAQKTRRFKIVATVLVAVLAIGAYAGWLLFIYAPGSEVAALTTPPPPDTTPGVARDMGPAVDADVLRDMLRSRSAVLPVGLATLAATALSILVVWLGLGLTYLGLLLAAAGVGVPLVLLEPTRAIGLLILGAAALTASFTILMQAARLLLARSEAAFAIAGNVLNEAVRMKIGLIFIALVIILLVMLPGLLDPEQPLRYRVQSFLQYSVGGSFWVLAVMTVFFAVGTVAFDQRDRTIWQTMSKPVAPYEYILGKWLGVVVLNAVLLTVTASGVFLFTEYLRRQPAMGEVAAFVPADRDPTPTNDRMILETQVLTARAAAEGRPQQFSEEDIRRLTEQRVEQALREELDRASDPARLEWLRSQSEAEVRKILESRARSIPPAQSRVWTFEGLSRAEQINEPVTLRYKINAGADDPDVLYNVVFVLIADEGANRVYQRQVALNQFQTLSFRPVEYNEQGEISDLITGQGALRVEVYNGDPFSGRFNPREMRVAPDAIEILYEAGSYEANFMRVIAALLVKLAFIAAVGVAAATFVSFPVASLITGAVLFIAETSGFLMVALEEYPFFTPEGDLDPVAVLIRGPTIPFATAFQPYSSLNPTENLVDGRLVPWTEMLGSGAVILLASAAALTAGWALFRRRELAIYSGH